MSLSLTPPPQTIHIQRTPPPPLDEGTGGGGTETIKWQWCADLHSLPEEWMAGKQSSEPPWHQPGPRESLRQTRLGNFSKTAKVTPRHLSLPLLNENICFLHQVSDLYPFGQPDQHLSPWPCSLGMGKSIAVYDSLLNAISFFRRPFWVPTHSWYISVHL